MTDDLDSWSLAGQCLVAGFQGTAVDGATAALLSDLRPAGIILFSRNLQERSQIRDLMQQLREVSAPRLVCVDQEGGRVDRLRAVFPRFPSAESLARLGRSELLHDYGRLTGRILRAFGFNVNLAPVLDLHCHDEDNALRTRYLGHDPESVSALAAAYLSALQSTGVWGCGKHFPGLGRARLDPHAGLPDVDVPAGRLLAEDLLPYERLAAQLKIIMVSHANYPQLRPALPGGRQSRAASGAAAGRRVPASCAPEVYRMLRRVLGFAGVAVTDDLEMGAVHAALPADEIPVRAFRAGADLLLTGGRLDFACCCRDHLASLLEKPWWRRQALRRIKRLDNLPPPPAVDSDEVEALEEVFCDWKARAGLKLEG